MTATVSDFIAATGFSLRDAVALSDASLNLTNPKQDVVPSPPVLPQGLRFSVADGTNTDYYRVGVGVTGSIVAGGMDWVGVDIHPAAVRAYASGLSVTFRPFVSPKGFAPTVTVKAHESTSVNLLDYFEMVGGRDADLSFVARPGGAEAQLAVSGSSLTVAGRTNGTMTASISAHDRAQGVATRTFSFVVLPANRPPQSDRAIGNPSVGVGATRVYDLSLYFSDPDVDTLTYTVTGATSPDSRRRRRQWYGAHHRRPFHRRDDPCHNRIRRHTRYLPAGARHRSPQPAATACRARRARGPEPWRPNGDPRHCRRLHRPGRRNAVLAGAV